MSYYNLYVRDITITISKIYLYTDNYKNEVGH